MIDAAFVEQRMRDVNPISGVDDIDTEELSRAVAVAVAARARAAAMQPPTQHQVTPTLPTAPPPLRRRRVRAFAAAFILILATISIAALALRNNNPPVADEPAPPTTATTTATNTNTATTTAAPSPAIGGWEAMPDNLKDLPWSMGTYESVGYSCPGAGKTAIDCDAPHRVNFTTAWLGSDYPETDQSFVDLFGQYDPDSEPFPADSPYSGPAPYVGVIGAVDDGPLRGLGHGIRVEQLDYPPSGLEIGGEAWIQVTVSSLSANDYAEKGGHLKPTENGYLREANSEGQPLTPSRMLQPDEHKIDSVTLVATNETMSRWIIALNQPGKYVYFASYWQGSSAQYGININLYRLLAP